MVLSGKHGIALVIIGAVFCAGMWLKLAPEHWLEKMTFATVRVDDRPVRADVYFGHPTDNEAEIIALVRVPGVGDYFLSFEDEKYREALGREFVHLHRGVWTFKSMLDGHFLAPLPFRNLNEFRIASSSGHVIYIQF
jgi:hypothetical protein